MEGHKWHHGFINGRPNWQVVLQAPVTPICTVHISVTGEVTLTALDKIIQHVELLREAYCQDTAESSITEADEGATAAQELLEKQPISDSDEQQNGEI